VPELMRQQSRDCYESSNYELVSIRTTLDLVKIRRYKRRIYSASWPDPPH